MTEGNTPCNINKLRAKESHAFDTIDEVSYTLFGTVERSFLSHAVKLAQPIVKASAEAHEHGERSGCRTCHGRLASLHRSWDA